MHINAIIEFIKSIPIQEEIGAEKNFHSHSSFSCIKHDISVKFFVLENGVGDGVGVIFFVSKLIYSIK